MERCILLTVENTFWITQNGRTLLIIHPNFSVPTGAKGRWKHITESVLILRPDGSEIPATAEVNMWHLNIADPEATIDARWRVGLHLTDVKKDDVPVGSKIVVSRNLADATGKVSFHCILPFTIIA